MIPLVTLEEHFFAEGVASRLSYSEKLKHVSPLLAKLEDVGPIRLEEMQKGAISLQVISHAPSLAGLDLKYCTAANNQLAGFVSNSDGRFAGFAALPTARPAEAVAELQRCVKQLGFVGALVDNHANGIFYDGVAYRSFWKAAQDLDVPIYLHPSYPSDELAQHYQGNFTDDAANGMGTSGFGWHTETGLHVLRLFASGLFDELPKLKVIIGHMGETLPFMLERIGTESSRWGWKRRTFKEVYDENIWITTSGVWSIKPMSTIVRNTKIDRILYSVDYPFADNRDGLKFMEELRDSGLVTKEQFEMIGYRNAEALLKVKAQDKPAAA